MNPQNNFKAIEFFSGIGGLHYGLQNASPLSSIVQSFDMNELANSVYHHNFKKKPNNRAIDHLKINEIEKYNAQVWLMSPPCQPFTRGGKYLDDLDPRTRPLIHLIDMLQKLEYKPTYIFLENVLNFEKSKTREILVKTLNELGYTIQEYLLSPVQLGVPNDRLRYYLLAKKSISNSESHKRKTSYLELNADEYLIKQFPESSKNFSNNLLLNLFGFTPQNNQLYKLEKFIDTKLDYEKFKVPMAYIKKRKNYDFDIVNTNSKHSSTFTKAYGSKHILGSGSLLQTETSNVDDKDLQKLVIQENVENEETIKLIESFKLRFFSPQEVAKLMCFPVKENNNENKSFVNLEFPTNTTIRQQHQLLGNSVNVLVVSTLIYHLLNDL
ncbi:hypothetical protein BB558_003068 [Smittium angustum]|uniref:tRNA (cytosine(38)-C(5))-methyltransferase n=1 Tax=Smittium angustum TaxID=133377 RepID=A0A2U1J6Z2_SMIAN|nr:hypothetical protein BB558_003068 [Smittium angustum]